ncbi:galactosylgalactosylxylosylprotein 3-beta-glucuronosyltransferase 2-like isoform X2 [Cimex lectularius]|nr:galactosylgalactosylxylosylprotein 3-beta-glucuronosyltransferase 2-like isoform X2 [Cimex lectularius]
MKQSMDEYEILLRETREQILDRLKMCQQDCQHWDPDLPIIYVITPTYSRPVQKAELTRFSQTLMLVSNIHWIIVEDSQKKTLLVENFLARSSLNYTHLFEQTPPFYQRKGAARGVVQRNAALRWLRKNRSLNDKGVVYFADDDNTYSIQVFREMRFTKEVSVWPVGLAGGLMVERPLVNMTTGKVIGFNSAWRPDRKFPIDMAGFAINLQHLLKKTTAAFTYNVTAGFQETYMLEQLTTKDRLEPKADNCTQVLVWHTRTERARLSEEDKLKRTKGIHSNGGIEV